MGTIPPMAAGLLPSPAHLRGLCVGALAGLFLASSACGGKVEDPLPHYTLDPHLGPPDAGKREVVVEDDASDDSISVSRTFVADDLDDEVPDVRDAGHVTQSA